MEWTKDKRAKKTNHNLQNTTKKRNIESLEPQFKTESGKCVGYVICNHISTLNV